MAGNKFGKNIEIMTFGESHGKAVVVVIDGIKPNIAITEKDIQKELDKRKPGQSRITTQRKETDKIEILSGIFKGKTTGTPICLVIWNKDQDSSRYEELKDIFRPGHADFTFYKKFGIRDYRGGGRSSGRETAARVASGAIAKKLLAKKQIKITAYVRQVGNIQAKDIDLEEIEKNPVRCPDKKTAKKMEKLILDTKKADDSVGGIIEVIAENVPAGLGEPVFDKLDADIAKALMSIGAVKGIEIGAGFKAAEMKGSESNDEFTKKGKKIITKTNNSGGILGGISNGMPIIARIAVKPTPSISKGQNTVDKKGKKTKIKIEGRHDPCICPRIVPVVESMFALVILDHIERHKSNKNG
jgi:chorismate synthase